MLEIVRNDLRELNETTVAHFLAQGGQEVGDEENQSATLDCELKQASRCIVNKFERSAIISTRFILLTPKNILDNVPCSV